MNNTEAKLHQPQTKPAGKRVSILGVDVDEISLGDLVEFITRVGGERRRIIVAYVNVYAVNLAYQQSWFRNFLNACELVFCDGFGVRWAGKFLSGVNLHRHTPPDWFSQLGKACAQRGLTLYFLGAKPGVAERAAEAAMAAAPGLRVIGVHHGYFDKSPASADQGVLLEEINRLRPDILLVGFGMPSQERWIQDNRIRLDVGVFMPVGAMFDYLAGTTPRAPRWMTDHGLEWLGRLAIEPRRLWKRYILGNPVFFWRVLLQKFGLKRFPLEDRP